MNNKRLIKRARKFTAPFRVTDGRGFRLKDVDPGDTLNLKSEDKPRAREASGHGRAEPWPNCRIYSMPRIAGACC